MKKTKHLIIITIFTMMVFTSFAQKRRIITAGSAITEIVCSLGHEAEIIATDKTSVFPISMTQLPSIGYRNGINAENIISQQPDLVLAEKGYIKDEVIEQLKATKIDFHDLIDPLSFQETKQLIRTIGKFLDEEEKAENLISTMTKDWLSLQKKLAKTQSKPKIIFVLSHNPGTQMVAGSDTFAHALFSMANAKNAAPLIKGFKPLNAEAMMLANPDFLLFGNRSFQALGGSPGVAAIAGVPQTEAGRNSQFIHLDLVMMSNFGPRLIQAVEALATSIHPELQKNLSHNE